MEAAPSTWWQRLVRAGKLLLWLTIIFLVIQQACAPYWLNSARTAILTRFQDERKSRVIAMIHREETVSFFGVPVSSYINIEDSEAVLRAIRLTPTEQPIDLILHTPGGLVLAAEQIATALADRKGKVTVFVPHYAMSGGTLIALAANEIVMDPNAVLGPVDPQIDGLPAASIVKILEAKKPSQVSDEMLILIDIAAKARLELATFVLDILQRRMPRDKAASLAQALTEGSVTHDFPLTVPLLRKTGLAVSTDMPRTVYDIMDLYRQSSAGRPSVMYVPPRQPPQTK
ncbi:MAG TPA: ATP-dependent Clp protease proteolytic subunit [Candidatus Binatia bacterium]|jgi:ClpP class serine protease